jgi:hypothetical protein
VVGPGAVGSVNSDAGADVETDVIVPSAGAPPNSGPSSCGTAENEASTPLVVMHHWIVAPFMSSLSVRQSTGSPSTICLLVCESGSDSSIPLSSVRGK